MAAVLIREAALQASREYGDGSLTTAILTDSLLSQGHRLISAGFSPVELRRGLQNSLPLLRDGLSEITVPFHEIPQEKFAAALAKHDEVARISLQAFQAVGADGVITVEDTQGRDTKLNVWDGARYDCGLMSTAFLKESDGKTVTLSNPYVLLSNVPIRTVEDIRMVLEDVIRANQSLLIITGEMSQEV